MCANPDPGFFGRIFFACGGAVGRLAAICGATPWMNGVTQSSDYMIEVIKDGQLFKSMYTDVHAYGPDQSYRCFHIHLPKGISNPNLKLRASDSCFDGHRA